MVSHLPGADETIINGVTGYHFTVGDHKELADLYQRLDGDPENYKRLSQNARKRILEEFALDRQKASLVRAIKKV
jgi:glycosyltransferase involved in cell wall biosynthesis